MSSSAFYVGGRAEAVVIHSIAARVKTRRICVPPCKSLTENGVFAVMRDFPKSSAAPCGGRAACPRAAPGATLRLRITTGCG